MMQVGDVVNYHFEDCYRVALYAQKGRKVARLIAITGGARSIDTIEVPLSQLGAGEPVQGYDSQKIARKFLRLSRTVGITQRAKRLLKEFI